MAASEIRIFYSWQSDLPGKQTRNLIQSGIDIAVKKIDKELALLGWKVLRFWGKDIKKHIEECIQVVDDAVIEAIIEE